MNQDMTDRLIITNFTDPVCTWCWGSEPVLRALETHYPDEIVYRYVMGGLVEDIFDYTGAGATVEDDQVQQINRQLAGHWLEAAKKHHMPVKADGFTLFSKEYPSTYPQNIAYKAAQKVDPIKADGFLRRIREATAAEGLVTSRQDVLVLLAKEVGLDTEQMMGFVEDGSAEVSFRVDMAINKTLGITGYPTAEIKYNERRYLLRGYQSFESYMEVIAQATDGKLMPKAPEKTEEILLEMLERIPKLAAEEVRQAFALKDLSEVDQWVHRLVQKGGIQKVDAEVGYFIVKTS